MLLFSFGIFFLSFSEIIIIVVEIILNRIRIKFAHMLIDLICHIIYS